MFGVGSQELLIIMLAVLLLFGSRRIPEVARSIGSGLQTFRRVVRDAQREIDLELLQEPGQKTTESPSGKSAPAAGAGGRKTTSQKAAPQLQGAEKPAGRGEASRKAGQ